MNTLRSIEILPQAVANQIAAGEVVERPASVLKELCENAIDAQATEIKVELLQGGIKRCCVSDNGMGIAEACLPKAVMPHATSKIRSVDDLFQIHSLGFRGEALASISSVSRFRITSRTASQEHGYQLVVEDAVAKEISPAAHPQGTTVEVDDLFYNLPVRKHFLKRNKTEYHQAHLLLRGMALSHPEITFSFFSEGKLVWRLPAAHDLEAQQQRIRRLMGKRFIDQSVMVDVEQDGVQLRGWLVTPDYMRSQQDQQYLFLNGRMVKDRMLMRCIREAYQPYLYPGRQACFVLYLQLPTEGVDVNVHPTKYEVRFQDPRVLHDFMSQHLAKLLSPANSDPAALECPEPRHERQQAPVLQGGEPPTTNVIYQTMGVTQGVPSAYLAVSTKFGLIAYDQGHILFDLSDCYRRWICELAQREYARGQSLPSRPLLVPVTVSSTEDDLIINDAAASVLGIELDQIGQRQWLVRTVPLLLPDLDCETLLDVFAQSYETTDAYFQALVHSHAISHGQLDMHQQKALVTYILEHAQETSWSGCCRLLQEADWRAMCHE